VLGLVLSKEKKTASAAPTKIVPESEIAALKAASQVWVNTDTGLFHNWWPVVWRAFAAPASVLETVSPAAELSKSVRLSDAS